MSPPKKIDHGKEEKQNMVTSRKANRDEAKRSGYEALLFSFFFLFPALLAMEDKIKCLGKLELTNPEQVDPSMPLDNKYYEIIQCA